MALSSGIPFFCGERLAHIGKVVSMAGSIQPVMKVYPRTIGGVLKAGGVVSKTLTMECQVIPPTTATRGDVEEFMNTINEKFGPHKGILRVDDNEFLQCAINTIKYDPKVVNNFLTYTIEFNMGVQSETTVIRQLTPSKLFADTRGRPGLFVSQHSVDGSEINREFEIWHNMDIVRDLENRLKIELYDVNSADNTIEIEGGFERITGYCWMKASGEDQEDGWRQTVGAYIYNIMNGPLGQRGVLYLGGKTINNALFTDVKLTEVFPTAARYELTFIVSLQC